jgi:hypothetical protein
MGATSVTGVGVGVANNQKGPGNNRDYFAPRNSPHVIAAGTVTTALTAATVTLPDHVDLPAASYVVLLTTVDAAAIARGVSVTVKTDNAAGLFTSFTIISEAAAQVVDWVVINMGFGLEVNPG